MYIVGIHVSSRSQPREGDSDETLLRSALFLDGKAAERDSSPIVGLK